MKIVVNLQSLILDVPNLTRKEMNEGQLNKVRKALYKWLEDRHVNIESIEEV